MYCLNSLITYFSIALYQQCEPLQLLISPSKLPHLCGGKSYLVSPDNETTVKLFQKVLDYIPSKRVGHTSIILSPASDILQHGIHIGNKNKNVTSLHLTIEIKPGYQNKENHHQLQMLQI